MLVTFRKGRRIEISNRKQNKQHVVSERKDLNGDKDKVLTRF